MNNLNQTLIVDEYTLECWEDLAVPDIDLFFFETMEQVRNHLPFVSLIIPRTEFNGHNSYQNIDINNSYQLWAVSKNGKYVCVASTQLIANLDGEKRTAILHIQKRLNRGLIYHWEFVQDVLNAVSGPNQKETLEILESYLIHNEGESHIAFQKKMWSLLPSEFKRKLLRKVAESYMDIEENPSLLDMKIPFSLEKYINRFPTMNGPNCFAATLAAATENSTVSEWVINQWVHPDTFLLGLEMRGYREVVCEIDHLEPSDIIAWKNEHSEIIHAAYYLGSDIFFNKNGQTFFNKWQVMRKETLVGIWGFENTTTYRCL
ncbi:MAG: hypothetical protein ACO1OT_15955 [Heyndrickxia sp.]